MAVDHMLPSAVKQFVSWSTTQPDLAAIHGGRSGTKLAATLPALRVQRVGGVTPDEWQDNPLLQVECWAPSEGVADTLARTVVAALPKFRGVYSAGRVYTAAVESFFWAPDDPQFSSNSRYILSVRLLTTP